MSWKLNTSLTQTDTMDRGSWINNSERKACRRTQKKGQNSKSTKKCKMTWEWGTNEYFYLPYVTILWCPSWKLPGDRGKNMQLIFRDSKELSWIWNLGFHFPKLDYHQWLKVHTFSIWEIRHLEEFNMLVLLSNSLLLKEEVVQRSGFTR